MSSPRTSTKLNTFHIIFIIKLTCFKVFVPPSTSIFKYQARYFLYNFPVKVSNKILAFSLRVAQVMEPHISTGVVFCDEF